MREFLIVLIVIFVLLGLTAYRYRRQISMLIGFGRMIREARSGITKQREPRAINAEPKELVNCTSCGTWVPQDRAIKFDARTFYCSKDCVQRSMTAS
ncbi:MAG: hypothetical protein KA746_07810 [Pyrinomonadaceae bacterium]|nr:hypothetical protein [Pyrinomonadaceae bacterium]